MSISSTKGCSKSDREKKEKMLKDDNILEIGWSCTPNEAGHCITCSDEALPATVLSVDANQLTALVALEMENATTEMEVDVSLVEPVEPGDIVLVHGGIALERKPQLASAGLKPEASQL
jgi:hydrogenase maturation factor